MKKLKVIIRVLGYGALGLFALFAAGWLIPFPIEGNWTSDWSLGWEANPHNFTRYENGKILSMSEYRELPPYWVGTYRKRGLGQYEMEWFVVGFDGELPRSVRSTFLRVKGGNEPDEEDSFGESSGKRNQIRDPHLITCRKIVNDPANDWVEKLDIFSPNMSFRVAGTADERLFVLRGKNWTQQKMETWVNGWVHHKPLQIYTAGNEVPVHVIETVVQNGFDYHVHSNQQWVATEWVGDDPSLPEWKRNSPLRSDEANPVWTNRAFQLIIRQLSDNDNPEDPDIYVWGRSAETFSTVKKNIETHRRLRESVTKHLPLYAEDGVLPEDVRQMFEPFGIDYHVLDEKILYRGKKR